MAAEVGLAGLDPLRYLEETNEEERSLMEGIARAASKLREIELGVQAHKIAEILNKAMGG